MNCRSSSLLQMIFAMRIQCGVVILRDDAKFMGYTGRVLGTYDEHTMIIFVTFLRMNRVNVEMCVVPHKLPKLFSYIGIDASWRGVNY